MGCQNYEERAEHFWTVLWPDPVDRVNTPSSEKNRSDDRLVEGCAE